MGSSQKDTHWLGFDLGATKMQATVFNRKFKVVGSCRTKTKDYKGAANGVRGIIETIEGALRKANLQHKDVGGIGVGCPGVLDLDKGVIVHAPNLGWRDVALAKAVGQKFGCPVALANDVDAGTFGEYRFGAGKGARCVVGVFPGTGIGGACVYEGRLLRGRVTSCMEIGHMHMQPKGRLCGCGRRGCLETVSSRLAISGEAAAAAYRGDAPHLSKLAGTDLTKIRSRTLVQAIKAGDTAIEDIVRHAAKPLGVAIASVVNLLAPDVVVLGGGLIEAMADYFIDEVRDAIEKQAMKPFRKSVEVLAAQLGDDAGVMGAAALAAEYADDHE